MKRLHKLIFALGTVAVACMICMPIMAAHIPTGANSTSSAAQFKHASPFSQNFVFDKPRIWIPLHQANIDVNTTNDGGITTTSVVRSVGTGSVSLLEINSSEVNGFTFDSDNDSVGFMIPIPHDIDLAQQIGLRVLWSNSEAAATGTARFYFKYIPLTVGTDAIAVGSTAMGTDGAAQADLGANVLQWSTWSYIAASTLTDVPGDGVLVFKLYVDVTTIADCSVFGVQLEYSRKWLGGDNL